MEIVDEALKISSPFQMKGEVVLLYEKRMYVCLCQLVYEKDQKQIRTLRSSRIRVGS